MASKRAKLVLIDGMALFHRAYHAIQHLSNKEGLPTNAVYGFVNMTLKAMADLKPDYAILAWDKAKTSLTQRSALYPDYKIKRLKMPEDFYAQIPFIRDFATAIGLPLVELDHYEADDVIGTIVTKHPELQTIIVTNDRDLFQLLDDHVEIYMQRQGMTETEVMNAAKVKTKYGILPYQIIDLKALEGDTSDNIPGIAGVGEKTAVDLIQRYGSLDGIYQHLDEITGKLHDRLTEGKEIAYLSYKLATIMCDAPIELDLEDARVGNYNKQAIHDLFRRLDFKSLLAKLPPELDVTPNLFSGEVAEKKRDHLVTAKYHSVQTAAELEALVKKLAAETSFAFDTETDSVDVTTANLVGLSFSFKEAEAYYVPVGHRAGKQLSVDEALKILTPILNNPKIGKTGHNLKFDYQILRRYDVTLSPIIFDSMIAAFLINPLGRAQSLDDLAYSEFGIEMIPIEEMIGKRGPSQTTFDSVTIEDATRYAAEDADISWRLYQRLAPQLKTEKLDKLAVELEWPLIPILAEMELAGIELDSDYLTKFNRMISAQILKLEDQISKLAGEKFNISSPAQLGRILFEKLGLTVQGVKRGKTGLSTAAKELEKMRGMHPIIDLLFEYRELVKLKTTYVDALPKLVSPLDGRIHTSFNQTIAQTGRLSSTNPNLQNIPIRTELGREIRKAFVAPRGRCFVSADYSQFELRIAAALAGDKAMIEAFAGGIDIHQQTAAELYGVKLDQVTKEQRYNAKTVNFGVLYGMGAHGLSVATGMTREEAAGFIQRYYELRPALAEFIKRVIAQAHEQEYTATIFGRRRPCAEINSNNHILAAAAERYAFNMVVQGSQADIMKLAMIKLSKQFDHGTKLLLQIHDELIVETDEAKAEAVAEQMKRTMESVYDLGVRVVVDTAIGKSWGEIG